MSDILEPKSLVNKAYDNIDLVEFDEFINNINKYETLGVGVILKASSDIMLRKDSMYFIELVIFDFNNFDDGRCYSQAYFLSKRWGFKGEIIGINAHLDQLQFMLRSGVTSYELLEDYKGFNEEDYSNGFSICYQAAANNSGLKQEY